MMNPGNQPSPFESESQTTPRVLNQEEKKIIRKCSIDLYYTVGLPCALLYEVMASYFSKKPAVEESMQQVLKKKGLRVIKNTLLIGLLSIPKCYYDMVYRRAQLEENIRALQDQGIIKLEGTQSVTQAKDLNPTNPVRNFRDLEGNFSSDYDTTKFIPDDVEGIKTPRTTYEDLRAQHRLSYRGNKKPPLNLATEPRDPRTYSPPPEKPFFDESPPPPPPQKIVRKNKYGDEIEIE